MFNPFTVFGNPLLGIHGNYWGSLHPLSFQVSVDLLLPIHEIPAPPYIRERALGDTDDKSGAMGFPCKMMENFSGVSPVLKKRVVKKVMSWEFLNIHQNKMWNIDTAGIFDNIHEASNHISTLHNHELEVARKLIGPQWHFQGRQRPRNICSFLRFEFMHSWHHFQCDALQSRVKQLQACERPSHIRQMLRACARKILHKNKRQSGYCWDLQAFHHTKASWGCWLLQLSNKNDGTLIQIIELQGRISLHISDMFATYSQGLTAIIQGSSDICNFLMLHVFQMCPIKLHCNQLCQASVTHLGE